jgi:probable HAF family extracellular repeat protein
MHKNRFPLSRQLISLFSFAFIATSINAAPAYNVQLLSGNGETWGYAINNLGVVAGFDYGRQSGINRASTWTQGVQSKFSVNAWPSSDAMGINDIGQIVGNVFSNSINPTPSAVRWNSDSTVVALASLSGFDYSRGNGINDRGEVVGQSGASNGARAVRWDIAGAVHVLETLGGIASEANGINMSGQIVGTSLNVDNSINYAVRWDADIVSILPYIGGFSGNAYGINEMGQVAGYSYTANNATTHAVRWEADRSVVDLGTLTGDERSYAYGISELGNVVGSSYKSISSPGHAVLWDEFGFATDLNTFLGDDALLSGWILESAFGINDQGWITGYASNRSLGITSAFLLSLEPPSVVPTPGSLALVALGLSSLIWVRRQRKFGTD